MTERRSDGESEAELGRQRFGAEDFAGAAQCYDAALARQPGNGDWRDMRDLARANATAAMQIQVPDVAYFDAERLLAPPVVSPDTLPQGPASPRADGILVRLGRAVGEALGFVAGSSFGGLTRLWGAIVGYRTGVWTNWYRRPEPLAVLTLAYMREQLNAHNLVSTYPKGRLISFQSRGRAPPGVKHSRTADGSWNNLRNPMEGASGTRFLRNVQHDAIRPETGARLLSPNPREISRRLLTRGSEMKEVPFLNLLAAAWIQFQVHDWVSHGENVFPESHDIPLAEDDPARRRYGQTSLRVPRTQPDPTRSADDRIAVTHINEVTHWWDGSQIYGSDQATQDRLRSGVDGKLRVREGGLLPLDRHGIEDTGMVRNWWVGLSLLHLLFVREHNALCDLLKSRYARWTDARLFNVARLVNAAVMAKIHTVEWTPAILPNPSLNLALNANWYGILTNLLRKPEERRTRASINVRNAELGGVVGNAIDRHGAAFGLTEEFVEVYRLHSLLPEALRVRRRDGGETVEEIGLAATRQAGARLLLERHSPQDLLYSFGNQHPGQLVLDNYPKFMQELSIPGAPFYDMGAVDILRARERGVPRYNEFRRQLGLNPLRSFEELTDDADVVARLRAVYGDRPEDVEALDLLIGTLGEGHRPTGFGFGETMFQIFILNATRRLQTDRFYTDGYNEETYTPEGLAWIDRASLKTVLLRHYPELRSTGLGNVSNAFEPWDTDERLDLARHPLRACDRSLVKDPARGDAYR